MKGIDMSEGSFRPRKKSIPLVSELVSCAHCFPIFLFKKTSKITCCNDRRLKEPKIDSFRAKLSLFPSHTSPFPPFREKKTNFCSSHLSLVGPSVPMPPSQTQVGWLVGWLVGWQAAEEKVLLPPQSLYIKR